MSERTGARKEWGDVVGTESLAQRMIGAAWQHEDVLNVSEQTWPPHPKRFTLHMADGSKVEVTVESNYGRGPGHRERRER